MNKIEVKIYGLYNPQTMKIRYIGRTKQKLNKRLNTHICRSKNNNSYNANWIKSLIKDGIRPRIKLLQVVEGWEESHIIEKKLIQKHLVRHRLVNGDDRGPGNPYGPAKNVTEESIKNRIDKIKKYYSKEENKTQFYNKVYCYNLEGKLIKTFKSRVFAANELDIDAQKMANQMNSANGEKKIRKAIKGMYFSNKKYKKYPYTRSLESVDTIYIHFNDEIYASAREFKKTYNLSNWDLEQLSKQILTLKLNKLIGKNLFKVIKNNVAVLERNL